MSGRAWIDRVTPDELGVTALLGKPTDLNCLLMHVSQAHVDPAARQAN